MVTRKALLLLLLFTSILFAFPFVNAAQTTRIYELVHPIHFVAGSMDPIPVSAIVFYNGSAPGNLLVVGILDAGKSPQTIVPGIVTSSSRPCINPVPLAALCRMSVTAGSGAVRLEFRIGGILGDKHDMGSWDLNMTAVLVDQTGKLVPLSTSSVPFTIQLTPATLTLVVPPAVAVTVDGVTLRPGPVQVPVILGQHNISVPVIAQVNPTTRFRFDHWPDGTTDSNRTIFVSNDTTIEVTYIRQYSLTIVGPQATSIGAGWYDENTTATFSVASVEPMSGLLGALGGKLRFQAWYENGTLLTDHPTGSIVMSRPYTITAVWQTDYSIPAVIIVGILAIIGAGYLLMRRGKVTQRKRGRRTRK